MCLCGYSSQSPTQWSPLPITQPRRTLEDWLQWQRGLHPRRIDPGLERCAPVARRLGVDRPDFDVITVAGTAGKGACVAFLEGLLSAQGMRTGAYYSPYLIRFTETVRVAGHDAEEAALCRAFEAVERSRERTSLTEFECQTLGALELFREARVDVAVLEVGMGGREDAVNVVDPDVALVTNVSIDHVNWLGGSREAIAEHKAGILRPATPAVCAEREPPRTLSRRAAELGAPMFVLGRDYDYQRRGGTWRWQHGGVELDRLAPPALNGECQYDNAAAAVMAVSALPSAAPLQPQHVSRALSTVAFPGRQQVLPGPPERIIDVAHNVAAAHALKSTLDRRPVAGRTLAVFTMFADKDIASVVGCIAGAVDRWYVGGLPGRRGIDTRALVARMLEGSPTLDISPGPDVAGAYCRACRAAQTGDRIVVFGSFHGAREALRLENAAQGAET